MDGGERVLRSRKQVTQGQGSHDVDLPAAQAGDASEREHVIAAYTPLALRICSRLCGRYVKLGRDDEVSVALLALNEAIGAYRAETGVPFASFAETVMRRRLIDYFRRDKRFRETTFSDLEREDDEGGSFNPAEWDAAEVIHRDSVEQQDRRAEMAEYLELLGEYGITLEDLMRQGPRHADARERAVLVARAIAGDPSWAEYLRTRRSLPLREMERHPELGVSRKTIERQRKYIIAVALILLENMEMLRAYLPEG